MTVSSGGVARGGDLGHVVVLSWTPASGTLISTLLSGFGDRPERVTCIGPLPEADAAEAIASLAVDGRQAVYRSGSVHTAGFVRVLQDAGVPAARSVIVLPDAGVPEPDASSRLTCLAVREACADGPLPRIFVEIRDPDARAEFADIGVSSVFLPGFLRASLLTQACVDLSTFDFLLGLLTDSHQLRVVPTPDALRQLTFGEAVRRAEILEDGTPILLMGFHAAGTQEPLQINPAPTEPLAIASELVVLCERWFDEAELAKATSADRLLLGGER